MLCKPVERFSVASLICLLAVESLTADVPDAAARPRTTNMALPHRWVDADQLQFRRETDDGGWEAVRVDAASGAMEVLASSAGDGRGLGRQLHGGKVPRSGPSDDSIHLRFQNATAQPVQLFWVPARGPAVAYASIPPGQTYRQHTFAGHAWKVAGEDGSYYGSLVAAASQQPIVIKKTYPEPAKTALVRRRSRGREPSHARLKFEGGELRVRLAPDAEWQRYSLGRPLRGKTERTAPSLSPDGRFVAFWRRFRIADRPEFPKSVVGLFGKRSELEGYPLPLPGDPFDEYHLAVFDLEREQPVVLSDLPGVDFGRPKLRWRNDHELLFEKIDRGHQRYRLFSIDPLTATTRTLIDEATETFIWTTHGPPVKHLTYLPETDEAIYASERSGYRHLYLVDLTGAQPLRAITAGDYLVRELLHVDAEKRFVDVMVGEYYDDQDPYHRHLLRVDLDSGKVTALTDGDGDHRVEFSPDRDYVLVDFSRVDAPPVWELRRCRDGKRIAVLAEGKRLGNQTALPVRFSAKGRDGETDIWGWIVFPSDCDPQGPQRLPIVESIYAGPHDSHVPKRYRAGAWHADLTAAGLIVVRIDGMGTANRSKAFHDVCWQNLKDAGLPDRIAWLKAAAEAYPAMDLERVGIFGTSAGGQNAAGAVIFHGDFYKAAVASCGCHDNRFDKASWNEQWMGYPVGSHYAENSNLTHAARLQGKLLLLVGDRDRNVPPQATLWLAEALEHAGKPFELKRFSNQGHSDGGTAGRRMMRGFFLRTLAARGTKASGREAENKQPQHAERPQRTPSAE